MFENACSCSVFCSAFESEHVRTPCSGLNMFGAEAFFVLVGVRPVLFVFCLVFGWSLVACKNRRRHHCVWVFVFGRSCSDITVFVFGLVFAEHVFVFVPMFDLNDCSCSVNDVRSQPCLAQMAFVFQV